MMHIKRLGRIAIMVLLPIIAGGCAIHNRQPFDRSANSDLKAIGMLEPAFGGEYAVGEQNGAGIGVGGLVQGIIVAAAMEAQARSDMNQLTRLVTERKFDVAKEFQSALENELTRVGYKVKVLKPQRENPDFMEHYSGLDKEVDAYLDIALGAGYYRLNIFDDYVPSVFVRLRMIRKDGKVVYKDFVTYGYQFTHFELNIDSDRIYTFSNSDALMTEPDKALEGIRKGVPLLARQIAEDLSRQVQ